MTNSYKIGMIGLDTSHVSAFTKLLNDSSNEYHVPGGRIVTAYPGVASSDFAASFNRIDRFTNELKDQYGVEIVESAEAVAEASDGIMLMSVDGRVHLELFKKIVPYGKPIFVDKPFTLDSGSAAEMMKLAKQYGVPVMSSSSRRFADNFVEELQRTDLGAITGADFYGPMPIEPTQPGLFWYGVHIVEMLYTAFGKGCQQVTASTNEDYDVITGVWADGRIGTVRGSRIKGSNKIAGGLIHRADGTSFIDALASPRPGYASIVEQILKMFVSGVSPIEPEETVEIIRFMEAANESRLTGKTVKL